MLRVPFVSWLNPQQRSMIHISCDDADAMMIITIIIIVFLS